MQYHHTSKDKNSVSQRGFTLVELAMVMIVIGLLLLGLFKGFEMIQSSRIKSTIQTLKQLSAAHYTFVEKYKALPGDISNARARIPDCDAGNNCENGDGNTVLGTPINSTTDLDSTADVGENIQYWKHLALADLVSGIEHYADDAPANSRYALTHPSADVGGGWNALMTTTPAQAGEYGGVGIVYELTGTPNTNDVVIDPLTAERIDTTLDDGKPNSGVVTAEFSATDCEDDSTNSYITTTSADACIIYFRIIK